MPGSSSRPIVETPGAADNLSMIEIDHVTKRYGDKVAVEDLTLHRQARDRHRLPRPQRRREVDHDARDPRPRRARRRAARRSTASPTATSPAPLHEVGALLEARAIHTGRSAYNHLLAMAQTHGIGRQPRRGGDRARRARPRSRASAPAASRWAWASGSGIASALLGDPATLILDEPANGLDPEGILWIRNLLKGLAAEGRTVFLSSHLMSEMAHDRRAPDRDRPRPADRRHDGRRDRRAGLARTRGARAHAGGRRSCATALAADGVTIVEPSERDVLEVHGLTQRRRSARSRPRDGIVLHELTPQKASLEEAFMGLTGEAVEYHAGTAR